MSSHRVPFVPCAYVAATFASSRSPPHSLPHSPHCPPPPTPQGDYEYYHRTTFVAAKTKPLLLGNTEWDPDWVPTWSIARVALFLRRIGLKQYCHTFYDYGVDGLLLLKVRAPQMSFLVWFGSVRFGLVCVGPHCPSFFLSRGGGKWAHGRIFGC